MSKKFDEVVETLTSAAEAPQAYIQAWKDTHQAPVIGIFPMNFPVEIIAATGALPVIIQDSHEAITEGNNILAEFYCGYTRSIADQAAKGRLEIFDAFMNADHCIQLVGAVDVVRQLLPEKPVFFEHLIAAMDDSWTKGQVQEKIDAFIAEAERVTGQRISDEDLQHSFKIHNENRQLLRQIFAERRAGDARFSPRVLQTLIKSSMVMDKQEHSRLLQQLLDGSAAKPRDQRIRLHLSGHFCHAPKAELFELLEDCGAIIVDDDLYTGARYISTDMDASLPPRQALAEWYFARNVNIPCPTRVQRSVDWDSYLLDTMAASGAEGVIVMMAKFCEAHMFYYPELRKTLNEKKIPHLLIETEHEGMPVETIRTRVEAMIERIRRQSPAQAIQQEPVQ